MSRRERPPPSARRGCTLSLTSLRNVPLRRHLGGPAGCRISGQRTRPKTSALEAPRVASTRFFRFEPFVRPLGSLGSTLFAGLQPVGRTRNTSLSHNVSIWSPCEHTPPRFPLDLPDSVSQPPLLRICKPQQALPSREEVLQPTVVTQDSIDDPTPSAYHLAGQ
jgi:hypothetical protein